MNRFPAPRSRAEQNWRGSCLFLTGGGWLGTGGRWQREEGRYKELLGGRLGEMEVRGAGNHSWACRPAPGTGEGETAWQLANISINVHLSPILQQGPTRLTVPSTSSFSC